MPKGCWWDGTNPVHPWSKQPDSPPSKLPLLTCFMNCKPPKAKPVLSQCSIIPNSCSKGNSLLTAHRILQPRVALEGRAGTACMGDGVLQGLRLQSGPLRRLGGQRTFPGLQTKGGKVHGKQRLQTTSPLLLRNILINPSLRAKPQSLDAPALSPHCSGIREQHGKAGPQEHAQPGGQEDNPPLLPWSTNHSQSVAKEGLPSRVERHPHYSRATHSHASTQIASLNVIALSQFHEFNIVPGLLFA